MGFGSVLKNGFTRRRFMKGALLGAGAVATGSAWEIAQAMATGKKAGDVRGYGVEPGRVQIGANENPLGASPRAVAAIAENLHKINRYDFGVDLPVRLNKMHNVPGVEGFELSFEDMRSFMRFRELNRVMVTPGSGPILQALAVIAAGNGGECIEAVPGYGSVARGFQSFQMMGKDVSVVRVPTTGDFVHDLGAMKAAITPKTSLIVVTNPNNPTGTIVPYDELVSLVDAAPEQAIVLIDEAYIHFVRDPNYQDAVKLALERDNVVVARTFSKIYGLAGMRIGYAVSGQRMMDMLMAHMGFFGGGLSTLGMHAALAAIDDVEFVDRTLKVVNDGKDYLSTEFDRLGLAYTPSHGNYMIVDVGRDSRRMSGELFRRGVMIRSGSGYRTREIDLLGNHLRVTIGKPDELEVFVNELEDILGGSRQG